MTTDNSFKNRLLQSSSRSFEQGIPTRHNFNFEPKSGFDLNLRLAPPNLTESQRGLVISAPCQFHADGRISIGGGMNSDLMRFYLLFWDKFDWPDNRLISIGAPDEDLDFLIKSGIVYRSQITGVIKGNAPEAMMAAHLGIFDKLAERDPGYWSLASGKDAMSFPDEYLTKQNGIMFELHNAIPTPDRSVPFEEILEFKEKRGSELLALRHHLAEVYDKIISSPDTDLAARVEFEKVDLSVSDCVRVLRESHFPLRMTGFSAHLNLPEAVTAAGTVIASVQSGLPLTSSLMTGAVAAFTIKAGASLKGAPAHSTPYQYVSSLYKAFDLPRDPPNKSETPWS